MRLIDADALETVITQLNENGWEITRGEYKLIDSVLFEMQTIEPEPQWIPVTERLPKEEKGHYWICTDTGYQCQCRWTNDVYGLGASDRWEWKIFDIPQYQKVIAWMPLPEPYAERRTDEAD